MSILRWIGVFIQDQVLGMKWLHQLVETMLERVGIDTASMIGGSLHFFIYDVIKIFTLLSVLIFTISYIQSFFPPERTRRILGRFQGITANTLAALLGTVTPFCSCSSIPLFIGFTSAGLPLGVTFSFLISSPLVDLGSLILLTSIFGGSIAIAYVVVGLVLAIIGGTVIEKLRLGHHIEQFVMDIPFADHETSIPTKRERLLYAKEQMVATVKKVTLYIFIGVGIGAFIHNVIPETFIQSVLGTNNAFSVVIATLLGIPMYADIFGTIPIAEALYAKGVGLGTILSFMMAVTALSLPSLIMLRKVVKPKLLTLFIFIITIGIIIIGYLFNALQFLFV
ncbi:MAG: permease [Caldisericia bacterium]|nr:permease [Caldisericia bacterium]MDD4614874.1 permease [Caldisericia bacterium]